MMRGFVVTAVGMLMIATAAGADDRIAADDSPFPPVEAATAPFKATLPFVHDKLGVKPEELGIKLYSTDKSKDLLARRVDPKLIHSEWFGWGFAGSDAFGVDLAGGRIVRFTLLYKTANAGRAAQVQAAMSRLGKANGDLYAVKNQAAGGQAFPVQASADPNAATFGLDPVEWYLTTHRIDADIAAGMRARNPVKGMTVEAALMTFGDPESRSGSEEERILEWHCRGAFKRKSQGQVHSSPEDVGRAIQESLMQPPEMHVVRSIRASFIGGKLAEFSDDHFKPDDDLVPVGPGQR